MFINILGCDGCGKSTQIESLKQWIESRYSTKCRTIEKKQTFLSNRCPEFGNTIEEYRKLAYEVLPSMKGETRALMLFHMYLSLVLTEPPRNDEIVFVDGYWQKHYATERAMGVDEAWLLNVCSVFPKPSLTIVIDTDPNVIAARGHVPTPYEAGCDSGRNLESFIEHQTLVRQAILELAKRYSYVVIDGRNTQDKVFEMLQGTLRAFI